MNPNSKNSESDKFGGGTDSRHHTPPISSHAFIPKQNNTKRWLIALLVFILLIGGCFKLLGVNEKPSENPTDYDPITLLPKKPTSFFKKIGRFVFSGDVTLKGQKNDRVNILLLGVGGEGHDGPQLTDTIMILSIKPSTKQIAMVSVPRDLGVEINGDGPRKINSANALAEKENPGSGPAATQKIIEKIFNIKIDYFIRIDFAAFSEMIDAMGGVTVNVERSFSDYTYPAANYEFQTISFEKGTTTMNGDTALKFARSRHGNNGEGSDFARAYRQQKIIMAAKQKFFSAGTLANPIKIYNLYKTLDKHILTNMDFSEMMALANYGRELNREDVATLVLDNSPDGLLKETYGADGSYLLLPKSGNYSDISKIIQNIFTVITPTNQNTPEQKTEIFTTSTAHIEIQNGTWQAGLAARYEKRLSDKNYKVSTIGNTEIRPQPMSAIYVITTTPPTKDASSLQNDLSIPIRQALPTGVTPSTTTDILIILGEDIHEQ
ncbi:MAG TPA: LCP family protein [Candidatus Magasanikbacteria bacterium]|nr:LCP family protein [Candidatus Magasanikbacteria bacterium]